VTHLGIKTADEPKIYRDFRETKSGYEVTLESGIKIKYRREEVQVFDNPTSALDWMYAALDERCEVLEKRIVHIRKQAAPEIARLQNEEWEATKL
jgi:hypothetical protein